MSPPLYRVKKRSRVGCYTGYTQSLVNGHIYNYHSWVYQPIIGGLTLYMYSIHAQGEPPQ